MNKRFTIFLSLSAAILLLLLTRMAMLAGLSGKDYRAESGRISEKTGELSAIRGRIFDEKENLLVWSERCYDLTVDTRDMTDQRYRFIREIYRKIFAGDKTMRYVQAILFISGKYKRVFRRESVTIVFSTPLASYVCHTRQMILFLLQN